MNDPDNKFSESQKAEITIKVANGLPIKDACKIYGIDEKLINSLQIKFPGGHISFAERVRLMQLEIDQISKRVAQLEQGKEG